MSSLGRPWEVSHKCTVTCADLDSRVFWEKNNFMSVNLITGQMAVKAL